MQHNTGQITTSDGLKLHTKSWLPDATPEAVILIAHGYGEHIGRYEHFAEMLVENGYAVYGIDHRGHGKSGGMQAYFKSMDEPVNDLRQYFQAIQQAHADQKYFLLGHSMGTLITLQFLLRSQGHFTGAILSGTATNSDGAIPAVVQSIAGALANLIPTVPLIPALGSDALSTDPNVAKAYDADPLVYRGSWRLGMAALLIRVGQNLRTQLHQITLPMLIMHGADDSIVPASGSQAVYDGISSVDKTLHIYDGMLHEIFNEQDKVRVFSDLLAWLNAY